MIAIIKTTRRKIVPDMETISAGPCCFCECIGETYSMNIATCRQLNVTCELTICENCEEILIDDDEDMIKSYIRCGIKEAMLDLHNFVGEERRSMLRRSRRNSI